MRTTNYWPAMVSTGLITAMLFAAASPAVAVDSKKRKKKAHQQMGQTQQPPTPTPNAGDYTFYGRYQDGSQKREPLATNFSTRYQDGSTKTKSPAPKDGNKTAADAAGRYSVDFDGVKADAKGSVDTQGKSNDPRFSIPAYGKPQPASSHKKGKKHRNKNSEGATDTKTNTNDILFDNVLAGDYQQIPSSTTSPAKGSSTTPKFTIPARKVDHPGDASDPNQKGHDNAYDGSPIHYKKPKPTGDTEDWQKKHEKKRHHHHDGDGRPDND